MSLILKSDKVASNTIFNVNDVLDNTNFMAFFEFNNDYFAYRDNGVVKNIALNDAIVVQRSTDATYKDKNNITQQARVNEPRIHYMQNHGKSGLLIEAGSKNLLANPYAPATQTVTVPAGALNSLGLVLTVEGTGSATMSGGIGGVTTTAATEGVPQYAYVDTPTNTATTTTVTITGNVTFFQLERRGYVDGGNYASERIPNDVLTVAPDKVSLTDLIGSKLDDAKTVVVQYLMKPRGETAKTGYAYHLFTLVSPEQKQVGIYLNGSVGINYSHQGLYTKTIKDNPLVTDRNKSIATPVGDIVSAGITYDAGGINLIHSSNGVSSLIDPAGTATTFNNILFGQDVNNPYVGGILTRVVMYDYKMTQAELGALTTKWSVV